MNQRGALLLEAMIATALTALLVIASLTALSMLQRCALRSARDADAARSLRAGVQLGIAEWAGLAPRLGDVLSLSAGAVVYRAVRGTAVACGAGAAGLLVAEADAAWLRLPAPGRDSIAVAAAPGDWRYVQVVAAPLAGVCPDGRPALNVAYDVGAGDPLAGVSWPAAIVLFEIAEVRRYSSGGNWWLGVRSVSAGEVIQPAIGPIAPTGLAFSGLDQAGGPAPGTLDVRDLEVTFRMLSGDSVQRRFHLATAPWP